MDQGYNAGLNAVEEQPVFGEEAGEAVDAALESDEARKPRIVRRLLAPTKEMVEEHNRTHAEYRDWCPHCRAGKSTGLHHRQGDPNEEKIGVTISDDYAFRLKEEQEDDLIPVLIAYDNVKKEHMGSRGRGEGHCQHIRCCELVSREDGCFWLLWSAGVTQERQ